MARPSGMYARLGVRDDGCGMNERVLRRIFKSCGEAGGSGIGIIHDIVMQAGGEIRADSAPGQGTTFNVHLPLAAGGHSSPNFSMR